MRKLAALREDDAYAADAAPGHRPLAPARRRLRVPAWLTSTDVWLGVTGTVVVIAIWYVLSSRKIISPASLPPPVVVGHRIIDLLGKGSFRGQLLNTLWTWVITMGVSAAIAIPVGTVIGFVSKLYRPAVGLIHSCRSVPTSVLIPVSVLVFGLGTSMKVVLASFAIFWPILLNTIYGVRGVEPQLISIAHSMRWSQGMILRRVVLPSALPFVATGLRVAGGIALIVVLSVEILGASSGLGTVIVKYQEIPRPGFVYAGIVLAGVLGVVLYSILVTIERRVLPWTNASRQASDNGS